MKTVWKETLQEIVLAIITLGISLLRKGKKHHQSKKDQYTAELEEDNPTPATEK